MMKRVAVVGVGQTRFGEHWTRSLRDLSTEAGGIAIADAGVAGKDIQALYIGNMSAGMFVGQEHLGALAADQSGLTPIPATRCEGACASGAMAFRQACLAIQSGKHDVVMAAGAEKMTDLKGTDAMATLMGAGDQEWESSVGLTFTGLYALLAVAHMKEFGTTREQMAMVSVNNHRNGIYNELAQFRMPITVEQVLSSPVVADPLTLLDCSPITDGASAVILASERVARKFDNPIWIMASAQASDTLALHDRKRLTEISSTKAAAREAYRQTGLKPRDMSLAEVHDCFSINEIIAIEDLGFAEKGKGGRFVEEGKIAVKGEMPVNTTGGLKSVGHPVGSTGIRQISDLVKQLRGQVDRNIRVKSPVRGLALNIGGTGATAVVSILSSQEGV
jgi:acetyl-CoA C-acetyltransferase